MWFLKAFFVIAVVAGLLFLASLNLSQRVDIYLKDPSVPTFQQVPLTWALLTAFSIGVLVWFAASIVQVLSAKSEVASLRRKSRQLTRELTDLRNMPVKDLDPESLGGDDASREG